MVPLHYNPLRPAHPAADAAGSPASCAWLSRIGRKPTCWRQLSIKQMSDFAFHVKQVVCDQIAFHVKHVGASTRSGLVLLRAITDEHR